MGSHHLVTVCMFCFLCATHTPCSAHSEVSHKGLRRIQDLRHEKFKMTENNDIERNYVRTLARIRKSAEVPRVENIEENGKLAEVENRLSPEFIPSSNHLLIDSNLMTDSFRKLDDKCKGSLCTSVNAESPKTPYFDDKRLVKHRQKIVKRSAHLSDSENAKHTENSSKEKKDEAFYNPVLKNIDVDFYIKKLFSKFGDRDTMTMNLEGFERLLGELDLKKMILEERMLPSGVFREPPVDTVINGVRSNSTNVTCISSVDLILSLNEMQKSDHHHDHSISTEHNHLSPQTNYNTTLDKLKSNVILKRGVFNKICPILLYQKVAPTSHERQGCIVEKNLPEVINKGAIDSSNHLEHDENFDDESNSYDNNRTAVWIYSTLCILVISACGLLGVAVIPIMDLTYYQQILQFLVALAIGTLSGDAMLHLLPHALAPDEHGHGSGKHDHSSHAPHSHNSMWKGLVAVLGVVFFYFTEKGLTLLAEWRKRIMRLNKENKLPSRVRVMRNDNLGCLKGSGSCSSRTGSSGFLRIPTAIFKTNSKNKQNVDSNNINSGKICKHKYSEYPYCYDEIASDTHDDHHVRDGNLHSNKNNVGSNKLPQIKDQEDNHHVCVVSFNNVKDNNFNANSHEPTVNDSLIVHNYDDSVADPHTQNQVNHPVIVNNLKLPDNSTSDDEKKVLKSDNDKRHAHGKTDSVDVDEKKSVNDHESYTVILREHSQTHHGHSHSHGHVHSPPSSLSSVVWMVIMGDGLHNFTDGMAIGAAFSSNIAGGFSTAIAVLCHELPHEIGDFAVLLKAGMSAKRAVFYNMLSSILCLFGMILGVIVGHTPEATAWVFAAAAGMFMYIALVDMIPELTSSHSNEGSFCQCVLQFLGLSTGIGIMLLIAMYEHELKKLFG